MVTRFFTLRVASLTAGIVGAFASAFVVVEGWPVVDALYFTATTFATIGFGDLKPARPEASTEEDHEKTMPEGFFLDFLAFFEVRRDLAAC